MDEVRAVGDADGSAVVGDESRAVGWDEDPAEPGGSSQTADQQQQQPSTYRLLKVS